MKTNTELSHSEQQAKAQCESILSMVRALDRETAAEDFAATLDRAECVKLLTDAGMHLDDGDTLEELQETVADQLNLENIETDAFEFDEDEARQTIQEDALSVEVRSGWYNPGSMDNSPEEFCILLCTGGPAVRLIGDLNEHNEPDRVRIEHQDWGTPWTEYFPESSEQREALLAYARQFYFGD